MGRREVNGKVDNFISSVWFTGFAHYDHADLRRARRIPGQVKPSGTSTWLTTAEARVEAVGRRVYDEAYNGQWYSYAAAARARQVRDHQFRAPGEWFA